MRAVLAALVAGCAVAVAGCSGAGTPAPAAAVVTSAADGNDVRLAAGLLTVADLPLGFQPQDGAGDQPEGSEGPDQSEDPDSD